MIKPPGGAKRPATPAERVERSKAKAIASGSRPTPRGMLPADAAAALAGLQASGYAASATACIARALVDAASRAKPPRV
jgi:anti-sigma factor RsiW